jgi:ankyrin repeat protein
MLLLDKIPTLSFSAYKESTNKQCKLKGPYRNDFKLSSVELDDVSFRFLIDNCHGNEIIRALQNNLRANSIASTAIVQSFSTFTLTSFQNDWGNNSEHILSSIFMAFLDNGIDPHKPYGSSNYILYPIHWASLHNNKLIFNHLYKNCEVSLSVSTSENETVLHFIAHSNNVELLDIVASDPLIHNNVFTAESNGDQPIHYAAIYSSLEFFKRLAEDTRVDANAPNEDAIQAIHMAAYRGNLNILKYLIEKCDSDPFAQPLFGRSPMYLGCSEGHLNICKFLMEMNVNYASDTKLLVLAIEMERFNLIKYFVEDCKMDPRITFDINNDNLFTLAVKTNALECRTKGIDVDAQTKTEIIEYLIGFGFNATKYDSFGYLPVHYAASNRDDPEVLKYLVAKIGVDYSLGITKGDEAGTTPYLAAVKRSRFDNARYLLSLPNVNVNQHDKYGRDVVYWVSLTAINYQLLDFLMLEANMDIHQPVELAVRNRIAKNRNFIQ